MDLGLIFRSFGLALGQLSDRRFRRVFFIGVGLSLGLLVGMTAGLAWLIDLLIPNRISIPWVGEITWLGDFLSWGAFFFLMVLSVFLMVPVASAITSMFLDDVASAVEAVHYPSLPPSMPVAFGDAFRDTVNFLGVLVGANILALFIYVVFAPAALFIFWGLNGYLLGREYYLMAAGRRVGRKQARKLLSSHFMTVWAAGILMAAPLSVPLVNLLIPILGAATFTHLFHRLPQGASAAKPPDLPR